jgi:hypothetical protein
VTRTLRLPEETDDAFRARAERTARIAGELIDACLRNRCMREFIADPALPHSDASVRLAPTVRVEYEQAVVIGDLGSCLSATKSKHWGPGPWVLPLHEDDVFDPLRVTYFYRKNSVYNRRFEQRMRLKELLGRRWRPLVGRAKKRTKTSFFYHRKN